MKFYRVKYAISVKMSMCHLCSGEFSESLTGFHFNDKFVCERCLICLQCNDIGNLALIENHILCERCLVQHTCRGMITEYQEEML